MELDFINANPAGLDVRGTPTLREAAGGFEVLFEVINRGTEALHGCWAYFIAKGELAELVDFAEVRVDVLGPGESRPLRLKVQEPSHEVQEPECEETIVLLALQLAVAGAAPVPMSDFLQPIRPAEPAVAMARSAATAKAVPLTRHGTTTLRIEDSARVVRADDDRVAIYAEVTNTSDLLLPAVRLQVLGYDGEGFIVALDEVGPFPLEPGQTRAGRVVLGPVDHVIATVGLFAVADAPPRGPAANLS